MCGFATFLLQGVQPGLSRIPQIAYFLVWGMRFLSYSFSNFPVSFPPYGYSLVKVSGLQDSFRRCGFSLPFASLPSGQLLRSYHLACPEGFLSNANKNALFFSFSFLSPFLNSFRMTQNETPRSLCHQYSFRCIVGKGFTPSLETVVLRGSAKAS